MVRKMLAATAIAAVGVMFACAEVFASTLCVNPAGSGRCLKTIGQAVSSASPGDTINVAAGTYAEQVTITESLSLVGVNAKKVIIDASNLPNGVTIGAFPGEPTTGVTVSGFTVENAQFEGILAQNASEITIANNIVTGNNLALSNGACPDLPSQETNESFDCGEGIHLMGVYHSNVIGNVSNNNAGGILLSDDAVGPTHDNLLMNNRVFDNASDCGITLASHVTCATPPCTVDPFGVHHNTISNNVSNHNGTGPHGDGAGVGIFASAPGTAAYGNVVTGNILTDNNLPGVAMHSHAPFQNLDGNVIINNTIAGNGADTADTKTTGTTGINLFSSGGTAVNGTIIAGNTIKREKVAVFVHDEADTSVEVHSNNLQTGPHSTGIANDGDGNVNGSVNWWGCAKGPGQHGCADVNGTVTTDPALRQPVK